MTGGVERQAALLYQEAYADSQYPLRTGKDHRGGVVIPRSMGPRVGDASPEVHNGRAIEIDGAGRAEVVATLEVLDERLEHRLETLGHDALDDCPIRELDTANLQLVVRVQHSQTSLSLSPSLGARP